LKIRTIDLLKHYLQENKMQQMNNEQFFLYMDNFIKTYKGDAGVLFSVVGVVFVGRVYGWKVIRLFISQGSYAKYQKVLGLEFKSIMPAETEFSDRALAYKAIKRLKEFWSIIKGSISLDNYGIEPKHRTLLI
jgi:hypothetical protein